VAVLAITHHPEARWRDGVIWTAREPSRDDLDEPYDVVSLNEGPEGLLAIGLT
jgi:hypothetical protein